MTTATRSAGARPATARDAAADVVPEGRGLLGVGHVLGDGLLLPPRRSAEGDEAGAELSETWRRQQQHVAMTCARDTLWCGQVLGPDSTP